MNVIFKGFLIAVNCKQSHSIEFKLPETTFLNDYQNLPVFIDIQYQ
ncbi:hypothetical protein GS527_13690 [Leptospira borgpetersenii]|nr:hypothetical protein GS510_13030 [Leptospira borgpetersenii]QHE41054.1 hypothetical protein GS527_13690 [Leptospira borgpetersenii]QHH51004.1 hypothetical protein GS516_13490 [Leptospira borgpetersenii]